MWYNNNYRRLSTFLKKGRITMKQEGTAQLDGNNNSMPVSIMAEYLSPPITLVSPNGRHHTLRKFLWMGHWGFADGDGIDVIVPARSTYSQVSVLVRAKLLVAGYYATGWDVFSLEGNKVGTYPPMSIGELQELVEKNNF